MPRPLPFMSGNFDNPPANDPYRETAERFVREILDNTQSTEEISPSGELYRAIARFHRRRERGTTLPSIHTMTSELDPTRRRVMQREAAESSPLFTLPPMTREDGRPVEQTEQTGGVRERAQSRLRALQRGGRPRLSNPNRYLERSSDASTPLQALTRISNAMREAADMAVSASNGLSELHHAGRQLEEASANLRTLLDDPVPNILAPTLEADSAERRGAKRRKLDSDQPESGFKGFRYGKYGQEEPGKLKMEIVSCDGGIFQDYSGNYAAENVLKNDTSVYCTKANRCNLVLRHQGGTVFDLKELIIKAPHSGYTAPVQEGMIFISMTSDDLLTRTANYQIQYSSPQPPSWRRGNDTLPPIRSIRHHSDGTMTTEQARARRLYDIGLQDEDCEYRTAQLPEDFVGGPEGRFNFTTEPSDSENDDPATTQRGARQRILRRVMSLRFEDSDTHQEDEDEDGEEDGDGDDEEDQVNWTYRPQPLGANASSVNLARHVVPDDTSPPPGAPGGSLRRRETASNITLSHSNSNSSLGTANEDTQSQSMDKERGEKEGLMAPHARFFIERDKSKCTVSFDPPVSSRFILLKMWSPEHRKGGNIDIQSVVVKGWAGPRFFPSVQMR